MDPDPRQQVTEFDHGTLPEDIFKEFEARRGAILKALTTDVEEFYQECDPEKDALSLYGYPDGNWQVAVHPDEVPPNLPQPVVGINFPRDDMERKEWLGQIAAHSVSWLLAVSFFYATYYCRFDVNSRNQLFELINSVPTLHDTVCPTEHRTSKGTRKVSRARPKSSNPTKAPPLAQSKQEGINDVDKREKSDMKKRKAVKEIKTSNVSSKLNEADPKSSNLTEVSQAPNPAQRKEEVIEDIDKMEGVKEEEKGKKEDECGYCGKSNDEIDNFWIGCDKCQNWFHGNCVGITPETADSMENYHCYKCVFDALHVEKK